MKMAEQRRRQPRRKQRQLSTSLTHVAIILLLLALFVSSPQTTDAFTSSPQQYIRRTTPSSKGQQPLQMMSFQWDELVYNAESTASAFASQSLENPTALWSSLPIMYGAGLLTSVSPCVWGLLPLTMSYISTAAGERADKKATLPTIAFAAGLASVFCTLGLLASSVGGVFGASSGGASDVLVPLVSSTVCFAMGLQLLDLVQLPLLNLKPTPSVSSLESDEILIDVNGKIMTAEQQEENGGSLLKTFLLGGSSALVASPCPTPVLTSILAYVAKSQDPLLGFVLLLGYTLGYSTPLLLVAATGGQALASLKEGGGYGKIGPWVTPLTAGILLWYGTNGLLTTLFGDPSLAGLAPILE